MKLSTLYLLARQVMAIVAIVQASTIVSLVTRVTSVGGD